MITRVPTEIATTRRELLTCALVGATAAGFASTAFANDGPERAKPQPPTGDVHDFDFFVGRWRGDNRRLKQRWVGSNDWDRFPGELHCEHRLGGVVNIDEVAFPTKGASGLTVRAFNLEQRRWHLYWINSKTGALFPPVIGGFTGDHGEFHGDDVDEGRPVKVVFRWRRLGPRAAHWEQAFSLDGREWETNWTCDFTRVG